MKVDFKKLVPLDIEGKPAWKDDYPFYKLIANTIYFRVSNLDLVEVGRQINTGMVVELSATDVKQIKNVLISKENSIASFARKAVIDFFDDLEKAKNETNKCPENKVA